MTAPDGLVIPAGMLVVAPRRVRPSHPISASSSGCRPSSSQRQMPPPLGPPLVLPTQASTRTDRVVSIACRDLLESDHCIGSCSRNRSFPLYLMNGVGYTPGLTVRSRSDASAFATTVHKCWPPQSQTERTGADGGLSARQVVLGGVPYELLVHREPEGRLDAQTTLHVPHRQLHPACDASSGEVLMMLHTSLLHSAGGAQFICRNLSTVVSRFC